MYLWSFVVVVASMANVSELQLWFDGVVIIMKEP